LIVQFARIGEIQQDEQEQGLMWCLTMFPLVTLEPVHLLEPINFSVHCCQTPGIKVSFQGMATIEQPLPIRPNYQDKGTHKVAAHVIIRPVWEWFKMLLRV